MRQTNNALTFLTSSYQAVFKHAYTAGLASSAVMLSLASPYALASVNADWDANPHNATTSADETQQGSNRILGQIQGQGQADYIHSGDHFVNNPDSKPTQWLSDNYYQTLTVNPSGDLTLGTGIDYDTSFYASESITINSGTLTAIGREQQLQIVQGAADGDSAITGSLESNNGNIRLTKAIMTVDQATINGGKVDIGQSFVWDRITGTGAIKKENVEAGLINQNGHATSDVAANYSSLNLGMGANGTSTISGSELNIGHYAALNALGSLTVNGGSVNFSGGKDVDGVQHALGEIAAKSFVSVASGSFNDTKIDVAADKTGAFFGQDLSINGTAAGSADITVGSGGVLQFAGQFTNTNASGEAIQTGYSGSGSVNTTFSSGTLNLNGNTNLTNAGTVTFGANSISVDASGTVQSTASNFTVNQNSGTITNASGAVLNIGEALAAGVSLDITQGTTFNLNGGVSNNSGTFNVNAGANYNVNGGTFNNAAAGNVNVHSGAAFTLASGSVNNAGNFAVNSGAGLNINGGTFTSAATGQINNAGNFSVNSGSSFNLSGGALNNAGTGVVNVNSGSHINLAAAADGSAAGTISNAAGAQFNVNDASDLSLSSGSFGNAGTVAFNSGSTFNAHGGDFNNSGTGIVNVNSGSHVKLAAAADGTTAGTINNQSGALFNVNDGSDLTITSGSLSNAGTVVFNSGSSLNINDGLFTNADTGIVNVNASNVTLASGSLANAGEFNLNSGSTYTQTSGTLANAGKFKLNSGTNAKVTGGVFQNFDTVNVESGASLVFSGTAVLDGSPTNPNNSQINIASGGSLSMSADVINGHSGDTYFYNGSTYAEAKLSNLGNINNSGSVNLTDGLFVADGSDSGSMGEKFSQALSGVGDTGLGQIYFNDAILMLESGSSIDTSSTKLATSKIGGNGNTTLYSQGDIRFAAKIDGSGENLNNFTKIVANNLTFANESGTGTVNSNDSITLKSVINNPDEDQKVSFTANTSVNTENGADLVLDNANLALSSELMLRNTSAADPNFGISDNSHIKQLNANVNLTSGSTLAVEAGTWQGQNINAQDSVLEVKGSAVGYDGNPFNTGAQLQANNLALTNSLGSIEQAALSVSGSMDVLGSGSGTSEVVANDSALSLGQLNINQGHLTAINSSQMDMASASVKDGTMLVDNAISEQTTPLQVNIAGNLSVLGSALAFVNNADVAVGTVDINTDGITNASGDFQGLAMINANFESQGDVSVNNGALISTSINLLANSDPAALREFTVGGKLSLTGNAFALLDSVNATAETIDINTTAIASGDVQTNGLFMTNSDVATGNVNVTNGTFQIANNTEQPQSLDINGDLKISGSGLADFNAVDGRVDFIALADSGSQFNLSNSELRTEGLESAGQVNLTNSDLNNYGKLENSGLFTAASGSNLQNHGNIYNSGSMSLDGSNLQSFGDLISEGQLTASNGSELRVNGNVDLGGNPSISGGLALSGSSSLEANDITLADNATLSTDSSKISADTIVSTGSGSMSFTNGSTVNIKGDSDHSTVDFAGDITLSASYLNLGDALDSLAMTYDKTDGLQIGGYGTYNPIKADSGSIIYVNLSGVPGSQGLTLSQLSNFVDKLMSGNGIVRFDGTINPQLAASYNPDQNRWEIDHDDLSKFGDFNFNFSTDETRKSVLVNASGTLAGEWFGIETDSGVTSFNVDKTLTILGQANAGTHSGDELNIAQDSGGNVVGVTLGSGSALNLQANGNIGNIIDENLSATLNISKATQINIKPIGDATRSQLKVGTLISSAMINVQDVNINTATFSGGGLTSDVVNVSGSLTANNADFIAQTSFNANGTNANNSTFRTATLNTGEFTGAGNKLIADTITTGNFSGSANNIQATDLTTGNFIGDGNTITANNFTADSLSGEANAIYVDNINVGSANLSKTQVEATIISLSGAGTFAATDIKASNFTGADLSLNSGSTMELTGDITATGQVNVIGDSSLKAQNMTLGSGDMYVGEEGNTNNPSGSSAAVSLATLNLNGNDLFLDPEFGQKTATMFVNNIGAAEHTASGSTVLNGNIVVGRNSALGLGSDEQDFHKELAKLQDATTQSLKSDGIGAYLYIDRTNIQLGDNKLIVGTEDLATLKEQLANGTARIYLGQQSGMQVTANALSSAQSGNGLIFSDLDSGDIIESKDGTLILPSFATAQDIGDIFGDQVQLASGSTIKVQTSNGLISGEINDSNDLHGSGDLVLDIDENARDILHDVSNPTFNYYMNVLAQQSGANQGNQGNTSGSTVSDPTDSNVDTSGSGSTTTPETEVAMLASAATANTGTSVTPRVQQSGAGYDFLSQAGGGGTGRAIEQSARLASFGMGVQIANQAAKTTSDAIGRRLSMHVNNSTVQDATVLTNNVSSVWVSPTYQNYSSSKFNADNLNYGADVDMYGMVAGADYTVANGVKVGAAVNIGKGDASGKGIAAGVKNDFKYYGAGLYASVQPAKNLTLSADASYTFVQSDMETDANLTGYNKITGSADSSAISAGVNAMYRFKAFGIDVAPHVGVRYNHIALDGYDFKADGTTIGHTDTDSADVLSLPFGVALSTEVVTANNWVLKPRADFTVTANIGGDSIGSESTFDGAVGSAKYNTEFMDSFHYGVDAGLTIQKGNFSVGANVGFNGSHNTSELTVDANAQYKF